MKKIPKNKNKSKPTKKQQTVKKQQTADNTLQNIVDALEDSTLIASEMDSINENLNETLRKIKDTNNKKFSFSELIKKANNTNVKSPGIVRGLEFSARAIWFMKNYKKKKLSEMDISDLTKMYKDFEKAELYYKDVINYAKKVKDGVLINEANIMIEEIEKSKLSFEMEFNKKELAKLKAEKETDKAEAEYIEKTRFKANKKEGGLVTKKELIKEISIQNERMDYLLDNIKGKGTGGGGMTPGGVKNILMGLLKNPVVLGVIGLGVAALGDTRKKGSAGTQSFDDHEYMANGKDDKVTSSEVMDSMKLISTSKILDVATADKVLDIYIDFKDRADRNNWTTKMNSTFRQYFVSMCVDYSKNYPKSPKIKIISAYRSPEEQQKLLDRWNDGDKTGIVYKPANPKNAPHCKGEAVDILASQVKILKSGGYLKRYGLSTVPGDPVHIELKGASKAAKAEEFEQKKQNNPPENISIEPKSEDPYYSQLAKSNMLKISNNKAKAVVSPSTKDLTEEEKINIEQQKASITQAKNESTIGDLKKPHISDEQLSEKNTLAVQIKAIEVSENDIFVSRGVIDSKVNLFKQKIEEEKENLSKGGDPRKVKTPEQKEVFKKQTEEKIKEYEKSLEEQLKLLEIENKTLEDIRVRKAELMARFNELEQDIKKSGSYQIQQTQSSGVNTNGSSIDLSKITFAEGMSTIQPPEQGITFTEEPKKVEEIKKPEEPKKVEPVKLVKKESKKIEEPNPLTSNIALINAENNEVTNRDQKGRLILIYNNTEYILDKEDEKLYNETKKISDAIERGVAQVKILENVKLKNIAAAQVNISKDDPEINKKIMYIQNTLHEKYGITDPKELVLKTNKIWESQKNNPDTNIDDIIKSIIIGTEVIPSAGIKITPIKSIDEKIENIDIFSVSPEHAKTLIIKEITNGEYVLPNGFSQDVIATKIHTVLMANKNTDTKRTIQLVLEDIKKSTINSADTYDNGKSNSSSTSTSKTGSSKSIIYEDKLISIEAIKTEIIKGKYTLPDGETPESIATQVYNNRIKTSSFESEISISQTIEAVIQGIKDKKTVKVVDTTLNPPALLNTVNEESNTTNNVVNNKQDTTLPILNMGTSVIQPSQPQNGPDVKPDSLHILGSWSFDGVFKYFKTGA